MRHRFLLGAGELGIQLFGDCAGHFALDTENVLQLAIVAFRPKMIVACGADQLHVDVHGIAGFLCTLPSRIFATPNCRPISGRLSGLVA